MHVLTDGVEAGGSAQCGADPGTRLGNAGRDSTGGVGRRLSGAWRPMFEVSGGEGTAGYSAREKSAAVEGKPDAFDGPGADRRQTGQQGGIPHLTPLYPLGQGCRHGQCKSAEDTNCGRPTHRMSLF